MTQPTTATTAEMRAWLRENVATTGIEVGERGFLSQAARDAYAKAHAAN